MLTRMKKWRNSQGLRFSKAILEEARITIGDEVKVPVRGRKIVIEPIQELRGRYELKELVSRMPKGYQVEELDWGARARKEEW